VVLYIRKGTLKADLESSDINPDDKLFLRFCVGINGQMEDRLWMVPELWSAWLDYFYAQDLKQRDAKDVCYVSGSADVALTEKHPKSINRASGNAKLITGNDSSNFSYRGRVETPVEAVTIGYEASQKAHQTLRWLIATRGYRCGTQAIVAWAVDDEKPVSSFYEDSFDIYHSQVLSPADALTKAQTQTFMDYAKLLKTALSSSGSVDKLKKHGRTIVILATDSATTGRMSITYYRRLAEGEYLERVIHWHYTCKWFQPFGSDKKDTGKLGYFVGAPSFDRIIEAVLGRKRSQNDDNYDKQKKAARERLLHCVFDGERIPRDMVTRAVNRASHPLALEKAKPNNQAERWEEWEQVLCTTCAMVRRYYDDYEGEEFDVALESPRTDRDYLYGRLLAVADRIESSARHKQGTTKDDRATNAMRYMTAFAQHPFLTWNMLFTQQLNPYIQQLNGAGWHLNQVEEIMGLFKDDDYESDSPLSGKYLLGFFAQRQAMRTKSAEQNNSVNGGESNESK